MQCRLPKKAKAEPKPAAAGKAGRQRRGSPSAKAKVLAKVPGVAKGAAKVPGVAKVLAKGPQSPKSPAATLRRPGGPKPRPRERAPAAAPAMAAVSYGAQLQSPMENPYCSCKLSG